MSREKFDAWRFTCRLDGARADYVRVLSDRLGLSAAEVVRLSLDVVTERVPPKVFDELKELPPETRRGIEKLTREVNRVGVNVNQAVRVINSRVVSELVDEDVDGDGGEDEDGDDVSEGVVDSVRVKSLGEDLIEEMTLIREKLIKLRGLLEESCR